MATTIRLARHGSKKAPFYRIVVANSRSPRDGRRLEQVGIYDPLATPEMVRFDAEKLARWLGDGAKPSDAVRQLIKRSGVMTASSSAESVAAPAEGEGASEASA